MEGEEEGGLRLSKRFNDKNSNGEVDYKTKPGTAWSHSYLNQKPWHPLSYPNQRRKWIAEQTHAHRERRSDEVRREYEQEQEFFRQTSLISKKEKEKIETMQAVSFMYVRPPGYNPESAKAAEIADQEKNSNEDPTASSSAPAADPSTNDNNKNKRPKDAFGRSLPTEQEFEVLSNAPRLETGAPARAKPFGIEVRNVKCLRCGKYGHQSGDRECPLKDAIMPNEENRLKRDDPLTAIIAQTDPTEALKWELKQKPGMSPPRGGFNPDDPNQQIVAEDIFDEYGGFLAGGSIPELLTNVSPSKPRKKLKKSKHRREASPGREVRVPESNGVSSSSDSGERILKKEKKKKRRIHSCEDTNQNRQHRSKKGSQKHCYSFADSDSVRHRRSKDRRRQSNSSEDSDSERHMRSKDRRRRQSNSSEDSDSQRNRRSKDRRKRHSSSSEDSDYERHQRSKDRRKRHSSSSEDSDYERHQRSKDRRKRHSNLSEEMDSDRQQRNKSSRKKHSYLSEDSEGHLRSRERRRRHSYSSEESDSDELHRSKDRRKNHSHSSDRYSNRHHRSEKSRQKHSYPGSSHDSDSDSDEHR